jgi:hypothetical protein
VNALARFERACATAVESAFARLFPSDLEPAHVGRKLVATMHADPSDTYIVRVHPNDFARFGDDRPFLEERWSSLLRETAASLGVAGAPHVVLHQDPHVVAGSVVTEAVFDDAVDRLVLVVDDRGTLRRYTLIDRLTIGRAPHNDIVLDDPRVSREHAVVWCDAEGYGIEDRRSANGTRLNGAPIFSGAIAPGDALILGDTPITVDTARG